MAQPTPYERPADAPCLREVVDLVEGWFPPAHAESWDAVGLVCGDPEDDVRRVLLAVDPTMATAAEAVGWGADLLLTHHPLMLKGVHTVGAHTPKGRVVHDLVRAGCGLMAAHTNADSPVGGVSDSLARALGLTDLRPLDPDEADPCDKIVVYVPIADADVLRAALIDAGAGSIGAYAECSFSVEGRARFRPVDGARAAIGRVGDQEEVAEERIEVVSPRHLRAGVLAAMRAAHPDEEVAHDVVELADLPHHDRGSGRLGRLAEPVTLREFAARVSQVLPETAHGVRVAGDPDDLVSTIALCGGAGDFLLDRARESGAEVFLTSDLRHHPAAELREHTSLGGAPALIDVAHWAAEWTWLPVLADRLRGVLGDTVEVRVSTTCTDPWTFRA